MLPRKNEIKVQLIAWGLSSTARWWHRGHFYLWTWLWSRVNRLPGWLCGQRSSCFRPSGRRPTARDASGSSSAPKRSTSGASRTCTTSWLAKVLVPSRASRERRRCWTTNSATCRRKTRWRAGPRDPCPPREDGCASGPKFLGRFCVFQRDGDEPDWRSRGPEAKAITVELSPAQAILSRQGSHFDNCKNQWWPFKLSRPWMTLWAS